MKVEKQEATYTVTLTISEALVICAHAGCQEKCNTLTELGRALGIALWMGKPDDRPLILRHPRRVAPWADSATR